MFAILLKNMWQLSRLNRVKNRRFSMKTYFESIIDKRPLYSGGAYVFTACVSCTSNSIKYEVHSPFESTKIFVDYIQARDYYLSLGGESK